MTVHIGQTEQHREHTLSRHSNRRLFGVVAAGAALAALLTTGTAAAQPGTGPGSAACEAAKARVTELTGDLERAKRAVDELRSEAAATNEDAVDPDATQTDPEGDPTGPDGAADVSEGPPLDTDEPAVGGIDPDDGVVPDAQVDPEGDPSGLDGALDRSEGVLDTNEDPVDPDGADGISPAEQRDIDRAVRVVNRVQRNLDNATARRDKMCASVTNPTSPPVSAPAPGETTVVWCVIKPGTCSQVEVDREGRLIREIRTVDCGQQVQLPPVSGVKRGEKVTVVDHRVVERVIKSRESSGSTTYELPGSGSTYTDPGYSGGQVTQVPRGSVDTGDGSAR
jgi:hypothetical protein